MLVQQALGACRDVLLRRLGERVQIDRAARRATGTVAGAGDGQLAVTLLGRLGRFLRLVRQALRSKAQRRASRRDLTQQAAQLHGIGLGRLLRQEASELRIGRRALERRHSLLLRCAVHDAARNAADARADKIGTGCTSPRAQYLHANLHGQRHAQRLARRVARNAACQCTSGASVQERKHVALRERVERLGRILRELVAHGQLLENICRAVDLLNEGSRLRVEDVRIDVGAVLPDPVGQLRRIALHPIRQRHDDLVSAARVRNHFEAHFQTRHLTDQRVVAGVFTKSSYHLRRNKRLLIANFFHDPVAYRARNIDARNSLKLTVSGKRFRRRAECFVQEHFRLNDVAPRLFMTFRVDFGQCPYSICFKHRFVLSCESTSHIKSWANVARSNILHKDV